ncbi:hypothetical protein [Sorangium sp. So ce887]|uniref:hypothetical protein n=1 Tax=Sorangium sp. So ce887 TaxID=3133324 RepID=UPI003F60F498
MGDTGVLVIFAYGTGQIHRRIHPARPDVLRALASYAGAAAPRPLAAARIVRARRGGASAW